MLAELKIENVAVIEKAEVQFTPGLNVLTGETGAGKSIMIDSINAILGNRTSRDLVRSGINGINLFRKLCDPALLFFLAGSQRIQRALCRDKSAVQCMVSGILCPILRVLIQQGQMGCRVGQAGAVVLAMDGQQPGGNIPHHAGGSGHTVNTAAAFSVRADLAVQQQVILGSVVNELAESARLDESLAPLSERLSDLYYGARELATDLADRLDGYDFDPGELDQIEERLDQIYRMKQRYGASVEELLTRRDKAAEELEGYQSSGKRIAELTQRKQELYRQTKAAAETLTQARLKAFTSMNRQMREALEFLNMPGVRMVLRHQRGPLASAGQDNIEFLISTNPGEEPKPLAKIASGGELSRIMLAFKSALADKDAISTVIYDEIDTGVSGLAAGRIGQKLKQTASGHQVLCITHTPQIAAFADNQLLIEKKVRDNRTFTEIHPLDLDGRVQVLARMISGDKVTDLSLANARELIEKSQG